MPSRYLREYSIQLEAEHNWNFGGDVRKRIYELSFNNVFLNYWRTSRICTWSPAWWTIA